MFFVWVGIGAMLFLAAVVESEEVREEMRELRVLSEGSLMLWCFSVLLVTVVMAVVWPLFLVDTEEDF
jgi:hypothetical protein